METKTYLYEVQDATFEITTEWLDENENGRKVVTVRQLSGPDRPPEVWQKALEGFVRDVIDRGGRVISTGYGVRGDD